MKKISTSLLLVCAVLSAMAQNTVPNAGFETWTDAQHATDWNSSFSETINYEFMGMPLTIPINYTAALRSTDAHSGSYAAKITPQQLDIMQMYQMNLPGIIQLGDFDISSLLDLDFENMDGFDNLNLTDYIKGGIAFNEVPQKVKAWVKYMPDYDTLSFVVLATRWNGTGAEVVARGDFSTPERMSSYTQVEIPVETLIEGATPDTLNIIFITSSGTETSLSTELYIDDVTILMPGEIEDRIFDVTNGPIVNIFPNPTSDFVTIQPACTLPYDAKMFNENGQVVWSANDMQNDAQISVSDFAKGVYFIQVKQSGKVRTEKIVVK